VIEYLVRRVRAKTIFTTHYHELTTLAETYEAVGNACLQVRDDGGEVTFLYKVLPGVSSQSYGIHVARLAGLPEEVVAHAEVLLTESVLLPARMAETGHHLLPRGDVPTLHPIEARLRGIDPLHTTPFAALQLLHDLRELVIQGASTDQLPPQAPR
jgi:DNA mismatch repair protein MutS